MIRKILLVGGGSAGHIFPALAVACELRKLLPEAEFYYAVGEDGPEVDLVDPKQFQKVAVTAARTPLKKSAYPAFIWHNLKGVKRAQRVLKDIAPDIIFAAGGFMSAPILAAASLQGIPYYLHEQNAVAGKVTRLFSRGAKRVFTSFPETRGLEQLGTKTAYLGNPIRPGFLKQAEAKARLGLLPESKLFLILGGSLGARYFNELISALSKTREWQKLKEEVDIQVKLVSGLVNSRTFAADSLKDKAISVEEFVDTKVWMPAADLVLARAGSSLLMELAACAKPAIIVPFPQAAEDHQRANAASFAEQEAIVLREESELDARMLVALIEELSLEESRSAELSCRINKLAKPQAAKDICEVILSDI
ncbi:MAG: UDP-N-acetylglucosamine--N-acetylmuramyl-(pentapeptide) pyrophosphoryl-undecaprenol N-acetylglucosamine transferase [Eubacteriales bacterium]|nr:UDP-N-acetylglucosamine--N-acetylmuramyl-(pentapeptide) pyrophosphoryl-undecaprenol N-acetylglucosamine transferase [Eubacteriales bacterium]